MLKIKDIEKLSLEKQKEVEDFVKFLLQKEETKSVQKRPFGLCQGKIIMADDFNAPISDQLLKEWGML